VKKKKKNQITSGGIFLTHTVETIYCLRVAKDMYF